MFKILIVDDEKKHRSGLSRLLYRLYPDDMLVEAESAEQALEVMGILECDIVVTDIRMDGMDGVELLKKIKERFPETAVIILSGYGEFQYAKDALKYGASDYLLKPVDIEEVKKSMEKVRGDIQEQQAKRKDRESMKRQLKESESVYMEYLMLQFVENPEFEKRSRVKEIFPMEQAGWIFLCSVKRSSETENFNRQEFRFAIKNYIQSSSYSFGTTIKDLYAILVLGKNKGDAAWFENMKRVLERSLPGCSFKFYISACHSNMYEEGAEAYKEAKMLWEYRFFEMGDCCDYSLLKERLGGDMNDISGQADTVISFVKQNNILAAYQFMKENVSAVCGERLPAPSSLCRAVMLLLFSVVKALEPMMSAEMKEKTDEMLMQIYQSETISALWRRIYSFLIELGKNIHYQKEIKGVDVLEHCREYLDQHYMEEITLETVAEKYYFNSSYFSSIFKNYFGKSFSNYLTERRMFEAKRLLAQTDDKIRDIAGKVGYRDANYFVRAFKKFYGYTPEEYRKIKAQD